MRVMLVCCNIGVFVSQLAENLRANNIDVDILDIGRCVYDLHDGGSLKFNKNTFFFNVLSKIPKIRNIAKKFIVTDFIDKHYHLFPKQDVINFHFFNLLNAVVLNYFVKKNPANINKIMVTIWGSDFYKAGFIKRIIDKYFYTKAKVISFTNEKTAEAFKVRYNHKFDAKCKIARFGLQPLKEISRAKKSISINQVIKGVNLNTGKINVVVGYNANSNQQHFAILEQLEKLPVDVLEKVVFIFPLGYGCANYKRKFVKRLTVSPVNYRILSDFLSYADVARLRLFTDVMLNLQQTDQFSGSMQETLFAEKIVITGAWLPYDVFFEKGVYIERIKSLSDLNEKLVYVIENLTVLKRKCFNNANIIESLSSWHVCINQWISLCNDICNG